ncbi:hemicentin-2-like, partial [Pieris rapae]|uniref:hemicentin-2-like n=1 Tax=Pieris rapae TaxID=64459 RepID=UPI001E2819F1
FTLFFVFHNVFSEDLKRSLTFVIDDTDSMHNEINQVKLKTTEVFHAVLNSNASEIEDFVLVTFNDPDVKLRINTKKEKEFLESLNDISVHGGGFCPEMSLTGINLGIKESRPYSLFYVFTDATAEDTYLYEEVKRNALNKFIQVTFLLTNDCGQRDSPNYKVYKKLAKVTGGEVFNIETDEVKTIMDYIIHTIKYKSEKIYNRHFPAHINEKITKEIPFSVDTKVQSLMLSLVGKKPHIVVKDSKGNKIKTETILKSKESYIIKIDPAVAGDFKAAIKSYGESNLDIKASTDVSFQYGFLVIPPTTVEDCKKAVPRPVAGEKTHLTIELSYNGHDVELQSAEILDLKGNLLEKYPLRIIKKGDNFYVTDEFISPSDIFKISVNGIVTSTKENIRRDATSAVDPWNKKSEPDRENAVKPIIDELKIKNDEKTSKIQITCNVKGFPEPDIHLTDAAGIFYIGKASLLILKISIDVSSYVSIFETTDDLDNIFICKTNNSMGFDEKSIDFKSLAEAPKIDASVNEYFKEMGQSLHIFCRVTKGKPKPSIKWFYKHPSSNEFSKLPINGKTLHIDKLGVGDAGAYKCEANNTKGFDSADFQVFVLYAPSIVNDLTSRKLTAVVGDRSLEIHCHATGNPKPDILWMKDGLPLTLGTKYFVENGTLIIRDIDIGDAGSLICKATNKFGNASETFDVDVLYPPYIGTGSEKVSVIVGELVSIDCDVSGLPLPSVRWFHEGREITSGGRYNIYRNYTLSFIATVSDTGVYKCEASNRLGDAIKEVHVDVNVFIPASIKPPLRRVYELGVGSSVRLDCVAEGTPKPTVKWLYKPFLGCCEKIISATFDNNTYAMDHILVNQSGHYICTAQNSNDDVKIYYEVYVKETPKLHELTNELCINKHNLYDTTQDNRDVKYHQPVKASFRNTRIKCSFASRRNAIIMVGYEANCHFWTVYEVCFNLDTRVPIYIRNIKHKSCANLMPIGLEGDSYVEFDLDSLYDCDRQKNYISKSALTDSYRKGGCFEKQQMVNPKDICPGMQAIAFEYINVAPQWSHYKVNWAEIERRVVALERTMDHGLNVWSGVSEQLSMPTSFGINTNITISDRYGRSITVPKYFWKIVCDMEKKACVVIVQVNSPEISSREDAEKFVLCKDICDSIGWLKNPDWKDYTKGYTYCCNYKEFYKKFNGICYIKGVKRVLV